MGLGVAKALQSGAQAVAASLERHLQHVLFQGLQAPEIDPVSGQRRQIVQLILAEQPLGNQRLGCYEQRIARERRRAGVGRVAEASRPERQNLPQRLAAAIEVVEKIERRGTKVADAEAARQRRWMEQDARAASVKEHCL